LLIDLPALPGPNHNSGKLVLEKNSNSSNNDNLYVIKAILIITEFYKI